jgi:GNAT superfamily N-acetyltransferase
MSFRFIEENLRESFRVLARERVRGDVLELPGLSIASLGVTFQMFNAVFLNSEVESQEDLDSRLLTAKQHFEKRGLPWSIWICEDWLPHAVRRKLSRSCERFGLKLASEMPGMIADSVTCVPSDLEFRRVDTIPTLNDFRAIGSTCFHVPPSWFGEVFDERFSARESFVCWVAYRDGEPVATAASVSCEGTTGIYNVATLPAFRKHGYGEAVTRHAVGSRGRIVLQSTSQGLRLYERMGFRAVTRILAYNSVR